jgi:AcrR family transcriptional regulator
VFRLYRTKRELFLAAVDRSYDHLLETFRAAADGQDDEAAAFRAMGHSYLGLIEDPKRLLFQFHAYAASGGDPEIRERVRARYVELFRFVRAASGASDDEVRVFMSAGLLISVSTAIGEPGLAEGGAYIPRVLKS